jgi:RHS repeat-associated protein
MRISTKTTVYHYDGMGCLTKIDHQNVAQYDYQWDAASRIISMNDGKYDYNKTNQLIAVNYAKLPAEKYNYDLNGNRSNYQIGKNNQLLHDGENTYEYDHEGNRISKGTTKYFWDYRNRLVRVETPQETVEYIYDYKNSLVRRSTSKGSEYFIHDGWQIVLTLDGNGNVTNKFLWGAKQDELIAQNSAYVLCDHLGTVRDLIGNGIAAHFEYNAFGQLLSKTGNTDSLFKYTVKMTDEVTGLQWNINRWYDAIVGRWVSADPIGFDGKDMNLFRYVHNSPIIMTDSEGLMTGIEFCLAIVAGVIAGLLTAAIIDFCNDCGSASPSLACSGSVPFCWNIIDGVPTTAPETGTITIPYGANCKRPCYSSSWFYCCTDKSGQYEGWGAYKCTKNSDNSLSLKFHMRTGIKTDCNAAPCSTWSTCSAGSFIYYNP